MTLHNGMTILRHSADRKRALVLCGDPEIIAVAHMVAGLPTGPRWECSPDHLDAFEQVYASRFPVSA